MEKLFPNLTGGRLQTKTDSGTTSPPPPLVTIAKPTQREVIEYREYTGRTEAVETVQVRARVSGYLERIAFTEGMDVAAGDLLFVIDPRMYEDALHEAEGNLTAAAARLKRAELDLSRARELLPSNSISQAEFDQLVAARDEASAQITSLEATVSRVKLNLEFTRVTSPITGRTGRALITVGNLVAADSTLLTTVVSMDPIYAYFDIDESSALNYRQRIRDNQVESARSTSIPVELGLANETDHPHRGYIDFVDNQTDPTTGNIRVRAKFENKDGLLIPGLFASVKVPFTRPYEAILVPEQALSMDQRGRYLLTVDDELTVSYRPVKVGAKQSDGLIVISEGITAEDRVIIRGVQKARPKGKVTLEETAEKSVTESTPKTTAEGGKP